MPPTLIDAIYLALKEASITAVVGENDFRLSDCRLDKRRKGSGLMVCAILNQRADN